MMRDPSLSFLGDFSLPDEEVENRMIAEIDAILDHPARLELPAGAVLFRQNDPLDGIWILLDGKVNLYKTINGQDVIFHSQTAGRIIGLLALARKSLSFFHCKSVTPVTMLRVTSADLDRALQQSSSLQASFITVLLRSMVRRNLRLVELQTEVLGLNRAIAAERDQVARTLKELEQAQAMLVESEKMATLGQLAAGVAHELNNPVAAISRAAQFVREDLERLSADVTHGPVFKEMLHRAFDQKSVSTREQRAYRKEISQSVADEELADRLVNIGIHSLDDFKTLGGALSGGEKDRLARLELYHQLGAALRNIDRCAERIAGLVKSLRSYIHADQPDEGAISLHEGLEDTLRLFANRLRDVTVEKDFGDIPAIHANAGELNQVWTNLIANALDAMNNQGTLVVRTAREDADHVTVQIIDSGPGIPPENMGRIFDLRFTTRKGRVDFGLGLGLSITRNIINRHGGRIDVASRPGRTEFRVRLPIVPAGSVESDSRSNP